MFNYFVLESFSSLVNLELKDYAVCHLVLSVENLMATPTFNV
jgi:hypothetical protein